MKRTDYQVAAWLPEGVQGQFAVQRFTVSSGAANLASATFAFAFGGRHIAPGTYTRLVQGDALWMSDTPGEVRDHIGAIVFAKGRVLVTGLGLGMVTAAMLARDEVQHITVIEKQPEVVALVGPPLIARVGSSRVEIVTADAFSWVPPAGARYDYAWHDVWPEITADNLPEYAKIKRRYARFMASPRQQHCWAEELCRRQQ